MKPVQRVEKNVAFTPGPGGFMPSPVKLIGTSRRISAGKPESVRLL